jgi:soluble lytic murein transglycosylase-like protein
VAIRQDDATRNEALLTALMMDPQLRKAYRKNPRQVLREFGLEHVTIPEHPTEALRTLGKLESRSGMMGVVFGAVAEGIGLVHLVENGQVNLDPDTEAVVQRASANVRQMTMAGVRPQTFSARAIEDAHEVAPVKAEPRAPSDWTPEPRQEDAAADGHQANAKLASTDADEPKAKDGSGAEDESPRRRNPLEDTPDRGGGAGGENRFDDEISHAAAKFDVDPALLKGLIKQESGFNPSARSPVGAAGLTQLMPATAEGLGVDDPMNPKQAINGGAQYLSEMLRLFDRDVEKGLAAYNAGPGNVKKYGGVPPFEETQNYVRNVMRFAEEFRHGKGAMDEPKGDFAQAPDDTPKLPETKEDAPPRQTGMVYYTRSEDKPGVAKLASVDDAQLPGNGSSGGGLQQRALHAAAGEIGVHEQGGEDMGPRVSEFQAATGAQRSPWCASFVTWAFEEAGHKMPAGNWAAVANWVGAARQHTAGLEIIKPEDARPGDIVAYDWGFGDDFGSDGHIGLVASKVTGGNFEAIEGNHSDQVGRADRNLEQANVVFMRLEPAP